ncbi:MAG: T9SS type A sorting domain-containing protein [Paludibacter sp.]|nr:T9SS type A sorting domain-containing protein [Paludibacter sp.]
MKQSINQSLTKDNKNTGLIQKSPQRGDLGGLKLLRLFCIAAAILISFQNNAQIVISEILASNKNSIKDQFGQNSDWIELYNNSTTTINLLNWTLTDDSTQPNKWGFPSVNLAPGQYMIVFASDNNIKEPLPYLHTNFKLTASGEYLALYNNSGILVSGIIPGFPQQYEDVSYCLVDGEYIYINTPTPWAANSAELYILPPYFSTQRGLFSAPFQLSLTCPTTSTTIKYTTNGSAPNLLNGTDYQAPLTIESTKVIRAVSILNNSLSVSATNTYIFPDQVLQQPDVLPMYPTKWGTGVIADYGMDPEICNNPKNSNNIVSSFSQLPIISLVSKPSNFFSDENNDSTGGIYVYTTNNWERAASVEIFGSGNADNLQINCGVQLQGGQSRLPSNSPKHSFRLVFKPKYGPAKMEYPLFPAHADATSKFNTIHIKAGYNNTWFHSNGDQRKGAQYIRDVWAKNTLHKMGHVSVNTRYAHLFINGLYWGLFNLSERIDKEFMETYFGGSESNYDVIKDYIEVVDGNLSAWNEMIAAVQAGVENNADYYRLLGKNPDGTDNLAYPVYLEPVNLIDYIILNFYGANQDWDQHNWAAGRERVDGRKGFNFFAWDTERILENVNTNIVTKNSTGYVTEIFQKLMKNPEFKMLFADRLHKHLYTNGCLTPDSIIADWEKFAREIQPAVFAESARWGDYRRDVRQSSSALLYTEDIWQTEKKRLIETYFPIRSGILINQFKAANMYPNIEAPLFNSYGGTVSNTFKLGMSAAEGTIYYSLKGDPRQTGSSIAADTYAYNTPITISDNLVTVRARAKSGNIWSAVTEATFSNDILQSLELNRQNTPQLYNYPNPVRDFTTIECNLPESGNVQILVLSMQGSVIETINLGYHISGNFKYRYNASNLKNGVYIYQIQCGIHKLNSKMTVIK